MPKIRGNPAEKWARRAAVAGDDYAEGVQNPRRGWAASAAGAEANWTQGVQQAASRKAFSRGVQQAGDQRWQRKALSKGVQRYAPGVADAKADYASRVQPYLDTIANLQLPQRGPKGDPRNLQRVAAIAQALHQKKVQGG